MRRLSVIAICAMSLVGWTGCGGGGGNGDQLSSELDYDEDQSRVLIEFNRELRSDEQLRARVRSQAKIDKRPLNCRSMAETMPAFADSAGSAAYVGPTVEEKMFETQTTPATLLGDSKADYKERLKNNYFVEICVTKAERVEYEESHSVRKARDNAGSNGKFDTYDDGDRIESNQAYAEACTDVLGEIPFWEKIGGEETKDWKTVDCTEVGTPIPTTVDGEKKYEWVDECDHPQYIYSHCEATASSPDSAEGPEGGSNGPRVAHARNDEGSHWVLLCRKAHRRNEPMGRYNDMAMIGHNPYSGQTCFFQNQLPRGQNNKPANNGKKIPHPADDVSSDESPQKWSDVWSSNIEGGIGPDGGIQCQGCHSNDPFIHTPWIDGAKDANGNPVVPKIGKNPDFAEGSNGPYKLVDAADQGWGQPQHLVSEEASACTRCHRIGKGQFTMKNYSARDHMDGGCVECGEPWIDRMIGEDSAWEGIRTESHKDFENTYWMPPDAHEVLNEEEWADSKYKEAVDFIKSCGEDPEQDKCDWADVPQEAGDPTELPEIEKSGKPLAKAALKALGAPYESTEASFEGSRRCSECHATSRVGFKSWMERTKDALSNDLDVRKNPSDMDQSTAKSIISYMKSEGESGHFAAYKLGVFTAGVQFPYFQKLFEKAYGADWGLKYGEFTQRVSMPKGSHPQMSAEEFATVVKWFVDEDLAHMDELLPGAPPPESCQQVRDRYGLEEGQAKPWLEEHVRTMFYEGWQARNEEAGIHMYGCGPDASAVDCFQGAEFTDKSSWTAGDVDGARSVVLHELGFETSFWMRSSADGRFVGNGGGSFNDMGATITDLETDTNIGIDGSYDPGFFPNNDGFIMQGAGAGLCGQSVLTDPNAYEDGIDFTESGCTNAEGINLYQHVAVNTDGGDYFIINSEFTSDPGSGSSDPEAPFNEGSTMKFTPMVFDGSDWTQKPSVVVDSPYEGDSALSPSGQMVVSRVAGKNGDPLGYMFRRVKATQNGDSYDISINQPVQFLCQSGAKANISYDERFMVTHAYENGTANLYMSDLLTGKTYQITDMPEETRALFPHFRSDGWIYYLADTEDGPNRVVASDAAVRLKKQLESP